MRAARLLLAILVAAAAGIAGASVVSAGPAPDPPPTGGADPAAGSVRVGARAADPRGGPPWAVRSYDSASGKRCIAAGRTDGKAFGPLDAAGEIRDVDAELAGSCAEPSAEPLQLVLAEYGDSGGAGPRSVLFGVGGENVVAVEVVGPGGRRAPVVLDAGRAFVVVRKGLSADGSWSAIVTLSDGTTRSYRR